MVTDSCRRIRVSLGRRTAFHFLCVLFRLLRPLLRRRANAADARRVLVVEPYGMGDMLALEPTLSALQSAGWSCEVVTRAAWQPLLPAGALVAAAVPVPWNQTSVGDLLRQAWRLRRKLPAVPAVGLDPRGDIRSLLLLAIVGCPRCLAFDHYVGFAVPLHLPGLETVPDDFDAMPKWQLNLRLAERLLGPPVPRRPPVFAGESAPPASSPARRIGLVPLAPWEGKIWPAAFWAELIRALRDLGLEPVVLCGPGESARARDAVAAEDLPFLENADVPSYAARLRGCAVVVTLDTGPMHLAAAVGCAVVALFGSGQLPLWEPAAARSVVLAAPGLASGPALHPVPENTAAARAGMAAISPARVLEAVKSLLTSLP